MVERSERTLLQRLQEQSSGRDLAQVAVDTLITLPEMKEFLDEFVGSLGSSEDPMAQAKRKILAATTDRPHPVFNRWAVFLSTGSLPPGIDELRHQAGLKTRGR